MRVKFSVLTIWVWAAWLLLVPGFVFCHTQKIPLVVDTDMALDDVRALILLFNSDLADIRLIISADGALSPAQGYRNLGQLLDRVNRQDIRLVAGIDLKQTPPPWSKYSQELFNTVPGEGDTPGDIAALTPAVTAVGEVLSSAPTPVVYLCLGPLTNLAQTLRAIPQAKGNISRVIYYGTPPDVSQPDWNSTRDIDAARSVFASGLPIYAFSTPEGNLLPFDTAFLEKIALIDFPAARLLVEIHRRPILAEPFSRSHFRVWDEMTVIYLNRPELFTFQGLKGHVFTLTGLDAPGVLHLYLAMLGSSPHQDPLKSEPVVLSSFPVKPGFYAPDLRPLVGQIIEKYGLEEWKACVLTNELHRHLGAYNVIGAKMGIRAREILGAPMDSLRVTSMAGNQPPQSCLNDGLQVSTGASLGRGSIEISSPGSEPAAIFYYQQKAVQLRLKPEVVDRIKASIQGAIKEFGDLTPAYFARIRELSIRSWLELDRRQIFQETAPTR